MADPTHEMSQAGPMPQSPPGLQTVVPIAVKEEHKADLLVTCGSLTPTDSSFVPSPTAPESTLPPGRLSAFLLPFKRSPKQVWTPSVLNVRPLLGVLALGISVGCMLFSLAVLLASNNQPVASWTVQPTVFLAIASALGNTALGFARFYAIPLAWWYSVSKGSSIKDLERQWEAGHSIVLALRHNTRMGLAGFATLLVAIMIIDGPLLQRATSVKVAIDTTNTTIALRLAPELPTGFSGISHNGGLFVSEAEIQVSNEWSTRAPIRLDMPPCSGTCRASARAPGVAKADCTSRTWPVTEKMLSDPNATWDDHMTPDPLTPGPENAELVVGLLDYVEASDGSGGNGSYVQTICDYLPAILEYDLVITGTQATVGDTRTIALANNTLRHSEALPLDQIQPNTMDALTDYLNVFVTANASVYIDAQSLRGQQTWVVDAAAMGGNAATVGKYLDWSAPGDTILLADPTPDIIASLNEMMLRGGVVATDWANITTLMDPGLSVEQTLQGSQTITQSVYCSDFRWFAGAAALELLAVLFVLPLFFGWWTLGKVPLLSPLELGLALDAPLLKNANSATGSSAAIKKLGDVRVMYGAAYYAKSPGDGGGETSERATYRLGIAETQDVQRPTKGMRFEV